MSIVDARLDKALKDPASDPELKVEISAYEPTDEEKDARSRVLRDFALGYQTMYRPRQEFNDLSLLQRDQVDSMAFNTYQPNNGEPAAGDTANSWRSNAIRPIERNKCISMAGHTAERLGFLRLQATDEDSTPNDDAAILMNGLLDWARYTYFPEEWWLHAVLQSEVSPACIIHQEYREVFRRQKTTRGKDGKWNYEDKLDEANSGFIGTIVPTDQIYIENIFEKDIQKQRFVIWRRVQSHDQLKAKYGSSKNWQYVRKGMQLLFNDANQGFYYAYDPNLRSELGEEVLYWSKDDGGLQLAIVNGVLMTEPDAKLVREDGLYPFAKWFYSWIRDNFFYGKSLSFSVSHDANIINTLYPVLVDGAILDTMKPMKYIGQDVIGSDVIIPGQTISLQDQNGKLEPVLPPLQTGNLLAAMSQVEKSLTETANTQILPKSRSTAYEMSVVEKDMQSQLAPFTSELIGASIQLTRLVLGDILQYCTIGDISAIKGAKSALKYKTFLVDIKGNKTRAKRRRIKFETLPKMDDSEKLKASYDLLEEQGGPNADTELIKADPKAIRKLKYSMIMSEDVLRPKSDALKFQENLATLDKVIALESSRPGLNNLEEVAKKLLYSTNPVTARDPEKFINKQQPGQMSPMDMIGKGMGSPGRQMTDVAPPASPEPPAIQERFNQG